MKTTRADILKPVKKVDVSSLIQGQLSVPSNATHAVVFDDKHIVNFCSENYTLLRNEDVMLPFEELLNNAGIGYTVTYRQRNQAQFYIDYELDGNETDLGNGDRVKPMVRLMNSYNGRVRYSFIFGVWRLVCSNGMFIQQEGSNLKLMHTLQIERDDAAGTSIDMVRNWMEETDTLLDPARELIEQDVIELEDRIMEVIEETNFPTRQAEAVMARANEEMEILKLRRANDWVVFNAFNYQLNHNPAINIHEHKTPKVDHSIMSYLLTY